MQWAPRKPIWTYPDKLRVAFFGVILGYDVVYGGTYLLGGKAEGPSHLLMRHYHIPIELWGGILAASAIAVWCGYAERGGLGCVSMWLFMAAMSVVTMINDTALTATGAQTPIAWALVHGIIVYGASSGLARRPPVDGE